MIKRRDKNEKKCIALLLIVSMINPMTIFAEQENRVVNEQTNQITILDENNEKITISKNNSILLGVSYYDSDGNPISLQNGNQISLQRGPSIPHGTMKIEDRVTDESRVIRDFGTLNFSSLDTFKASTMKIAGYIPRIGKWIERGQTLWDFVTSISNDLTGITHGSQVENTNEYTSRYFYHDIYAWNNDAKRWEEAGESLSKYHYLMSLIRVFNNGKWKYGTYNGNTNPMRPAQISKADNYMKKTQLCRYAHEEWEKGFRYTEQY